jgi:putative ABC transport system substrate-binding protein
MKRREFIVGLGGAAAWPLVARAQQPMPVVGYLSGRTPETEAVQLEEFRQGLKETGFAEGKNVAIETRWTGGQRERTPTLAKELVQRKVDVIITTGGPATALAVRAATSTIPIVFSIGGDPVVAGLVKNLGRPGGNSTGATSFNAALETKQLGLLRELVPSATTFALIVDTNAFSTDIQVESAQAAARAIGLQLFLYKVSTESEIDKAFAALVQEKAAAVMVGAGPFFLSRLNQFVALAERHSVPAMFTRREFVVAGGLTSYASNTADFRQIGIYAGRILKGEKPADLPVLQPTKFEWLINLKTAKALGITVPPTLLALADEVIE